MVISTLRGSFLTFIDRPAQTLLTGLAESEPRAPGPLATCLTPTSSRRKSFGGQNEAEDDKIDEDSQDILNDCRNRA